MSSLILKDYLVYNNHIDFYNKFAGIMAMNNTIHQKQVSQVVKDFITDDMYNKRNTIISLLIKSRNYENQYLAYLLYDLLSNDSNGNIDTQEQTMLFDSFPWPLKQCFKQAMKKTIQYTNELSNFDINKIPLEQQICLMKTEDSVKEKAMVKLKEVKAKSEDSGSKARQYLDGLLKIPFNVYTKEPIMFLMDENRKLILDVFRDNKIKKLEQKEADAAQLYFKVGQYKAASVSFKSVLRNYPESEKSDYYQYFIIKSLYLYAHSSIETKQKERYSNVVSAFEELQNEHPNSTFIKDAEKYKNLSINF